MRYNVLGMVLGFALVTKGRYRNIFCVLASTILDSISTFVLVEMSSSLYKMDLYYTAKNCRTGVNQA